MEHAEGGGMTALYQRKEVIGDCTLYLGDCLTVRPELGAVDALIADPPYGIGYKPTRNRAATHKGHRSFDHKDRLYGDTGNLDFDPTPWLDLCPDQIWWGANYYANKLPNALGRATGYDQSAKALVKDTGVQPL